MSNRVVEVLRNFSPAIEVYSIDESFLSLEGMAAVTQGNLSKYGQVIRQRVARWVGLPVCVGIGRVLLGQVVGEFGSGFGAPDANAHRQANPAGHAFTNFLPVVSEAAFANASHAIQAEEGLVNAVHLDIGREIPQDRYSTVAHVCIELIVLQH